MTNINLDILELIGAQSERMSDEFESNLVITKAHTIAKDFTNSTVVASRPWYKWVREAGMGGGVSQIPGVTVPDLVDLTVWIAYFPKQPYRRIVIGVDWDAVFAMTGYDGQTFTANHASDHEWPDYAPSFDAVTVYPRAYSQLRTYPGSGLSVNVSPHRYVQGNLLITYDGDLNISLLSHRPGSGLAVRVLVYLDRISNSIKLLSGDAVGDSELIMPPEPTFPSDAIWSALVRVDGDQTTVTEADILDVRGIVNSDSNLPGATAEGQILISNDGETLELGIPVVDADGNILTDGNGYIVVV